MLSSNFRITSVSWVVTLLTSESFQKTDLQLDIQMISSSGFSMLDAKLFSKPSTGIVDGRYFEQLWKSKSQYSEVSAAVFNCAWVLIYSIMQHGKSTLICCAERPIHADRGQKGVRPSLSPHEQLIRCCRVQYFRFFTSLHTKRASSFPFQ